MHIKREAKLGITAIIAIIIFIWGINFLKARSIFNRNNTFYSVYEQIDGLNQSSLVMYRGYKVGQVRNIQFTGAQYNEILVEYTVESNIEIPENSIASITSSDLMGTKVIELIPGNSPLFAKTQDTLSSHVQLGLLQQVNEKIAPIKDKAEKILTSLDTILSSLQGVLDGNSNGEFKGGLGSINRTLDNIEHMSIDLKRLIANESESISNVIENVNVITSNLKANSSNINRAIHNFSTLSDSISPEQVSLIIEKANSTMTSIDSITLMIASGKGTIGKMVNQEQLYNDLTAMSDNLNQLIIDLKDNPKKYINFSVFSRTPREVDTYNVVIASSDTPISKADNLYQKYPDLREARINGEYLYMTGPFKRLKVADKELDQTKKNYPNAYIIKISEILK